VTPKWGGKWGGYPRQVGRISGSNPNLGFDSENQMGRPRQGAPGDWMYLFLEIE
jgi:hypothetical protein